MILKEIVKKTAQIEKNAKNALASMGYYTILPQKIFLLAQRKKINPTQFLILSFLISKVSALDHNELKFSLNGKGGISEKLGLARNTATRNISELENLGFIDVFKNKKHQGQPNTYVLNLDFLASQLEGNKIMPQNCAKEYKVKPQNCAKGLAPKLYTSYYLNNFVIKNLSKAFSNKVIDALEKIKDENKIEREILLIFINEKNLEYFNAIQNKTNPFTYIKNGFDNWFIDFEENNQKNQANEKQNIENQISMRQVKYFDLLKKFKEWGYSENEITEQLEYQGFDGFEYGTAL